MERIILPLIDLYTQLYKLQNIHQALVDSYVFRHVLTLSSVAPLKWSVRKWAKTQPHTLKFSVATQECAQHRY